MPVTYVQSNRLVQTASGGAGGNLPAPNGLQDGDFLVYSAFASIDFPGTNVFSPPTGGSGATWTRIAPTDTGSVQVFYRIAQAADVGATFSCTWTTNGNAAGAIMSAYRGVASVGDTNRQVFGGVPNALVTNTEPRVVTMTPLPNASPERLAVWVTALASNSSGGPTNRRWQSPSAGLNMRSSVSLGDPLNTTGSGVIADLAISDYQAPSAQTTPTLTVQTASPGGNGGWGERSSAQIGLILAANLPPQAPAGFTAGAVEGAVLNRLHRVQWQAAVDVDGPVVKYDVDLSLDNGVTFVDLASISGNPASAFLDVDFSPYPNTAQARIRVRGEDGFGAIGPFATSNPFTIFHGGELRRLRNLKKAR